MANILLIYGHPKTPKSFNFDLKERLVKTLGDHGHNVLIRDLYEISFNPLLSSQDLELLHNNKISDDVKKEQDFIRNADIIIFIYPIWWCGQPAIIKGYIDRVFSYGFAYTYKGNNILGLLNDKRAIIINSTGTPYEEYNKNGMIKSIRQTVDNGIFEFCGLKKILHLFYGNVVKKSIEEKEADIKNATLETLTMIEHKD